MDQLGIKGSRGQRAARGSLKFGVSVIALLAAAGASAQGNPAAPSASPAGDVAAPTAPPANVQDGGISRSTDPVVSGAPAPDAREGEQTSATPPSATPDATDDDIVVTGIRSSLANSQNIKRNSDTVVDAITAEDIGALPDRSVTEALQRVPGVSISRFAAANDPDHFSVEGSGIVVRGLNYVRSEFNGRDTFSANGGRALNFQDVPPELIGSVEVFKNMAADQIEGGIAGTVNLNTRKPFDSRDPVIYVSADMNYGDLSRRGSPAVSGLLSQNFDTGIGRFGVLASGSYSQLFNRADSVVVTNYQDRFNGSRDLDGNGTIDGGETDNFPGLTAGQTVYAPIGAGIRTQDFNRERIGIAGALQFESTDKSVLATLQFLRSDARQTWGERAFETTPDAVNRQTLPAAGTSFTFDDDGLFQSGTISLDRGNTGDPDVPSTGQPALVTNRGVKTRAITDDYGANIKWQATDRLSFNFDGQYVHSTSENLDFSQFNATYGNVRLDTRGEFPDFAFLPPSGTASSYYSDPFRTYYRAAMDHFEQNDGEEFAFRADATYEFGDDSLLKRAKFGARYADRDQTVRYSVYNWGALSEVWAGSSPVYVGETDTANTTQFSFDDVFRGDGPKGVNSFYQRENIATNYDNAAARFVAINEIWASRGAFRSWNPAAQRPGVIAGTPYLPSEIYSNSEETKAAYARLDFGNSGIDLLGGIEFGGNIGLRYVRTTDAATGFLTLPNNQQVIGGAGSAAAFCAQPGQTDAFCRLTAQQQADALTFANGAAFGSQSRSTFDHWLPSFNLRVNITPKLLTRFAYSKAISRPGFEQLSNALQIGTGTNGASFQFQGQSRNANPNLRPVEANQFDLTAEWYFAKVGSITAAAFYKDLKNVVTTVAATRAVTNNGVTQIVNFVGPVNSDTNGTIKGFELAYQQTYDFLPGLLSGLGVQANYTYVDASDIPNGRVGTDTSTTTTVNQGNLPLAGLSKHTVNAALFYEKGPLSLRAAYNWRSSYLLTVRDEIAPFFPIYSAATGQLDGSMFLTVNDKFKIGLQGVNLLDAVTKTRSVINGDGLQAPRSFFRNDRRFSLVTRLKF